MALAWNSALRRWGIGAHPLDWRLPPIETYPAVVAFVQTVAGKLALFVAFALLLKPLTPLWLELTLAAAVVSLAGPYRPLAAFACTAAMIVRTGYGYSLKTMQAAVGQENLGAGIHYGYLIAGSLLAVVALSAAAILLARRFRDHPIGRRPVLLQHMLWFALALLASSQLLHGLPQVLLWSLVATFSACFWFLAYALLDQRQRQPAPLLLQLATFHPFFGQDRIPMGKSAGNWRNVEAPDAAELAVTQLKGLKLLAWAIVLKGLLWLFRRVVYGTFGVLPLTDAFDRFLQDGDAPLPFGFVSILANFPEQLLTVAVTGHVVIAIARLAGYRLLRNSCRPLSSRTIAEFWNRYFYYFKEAMVHVYFYPTYLRWFKRHPELRIAFATFMAAGVGNFFLHFVLNNDKIVQHGLFGALLRMEAYAFYCAVLVAGIVISQLNAHQPDPQAGWWRRQLLPSLGVAAFFCFLSFFDGIRPASLRLHFDFLFKVFGVDQWIRAIV